MNNSLPPQDRDVRLMTAQSHTVCCHSSCELRASGVGIISSPPLFPIPTLACWTPHLLARLSIRLPILPMVNLRAAAPATLPLRRQLCRRLVAHKGVSLEVRYWTTTGHLKALGRLLLCTQQGASNKLINHNQTIISRALQCIEPAIAWMCIDFIQRSLNGRRW